MLRASIGRIETIPASYILILGVEVTYIMKIYQRLAQWIYLPRLRTLEKEIGCRLVFHDIPDRYINAIMRYEMTAIWKRAGLDVVKGQNHWTVGTIVDGSSSRFDPNAAEYQSWLGGYTVRLSSEKMRSVGDYFELAIADQNAWLKYYGDPQPSTTIVGSELTELRRLQLGQYSGIVYEFRCTTHSDMGSRRKTMTHRYASSGMAALSNLANPHLALAADVFIPRAIANPYHPLDVSGFFAIFDVKPRVRVMLYATGVTDRFAVLKADFLSAMKSCEIIEV